MALRQRAPLAAPAEPVSSTAEPRRGPTVAGLRRLVRAAEQRGLRRAGAQERSARARLASSQAIWRLGLDAVDVALPRGGLAADGVHEIAAAAHGDAAVGTGFALALLRQLGASGPVLWCRSAQSTRETGRIHGHGLASFGLAAGRVVFADARRDADVLWALEQGARSGAFAVLLGEVDTASFTATRRLALAAAAGGTPLVLLRPHRELGASAACTRWRVGAAPSAPDILDLSAPGPPRWRVELTRCRGGRPGTWIVEWSHETHRFRLVAPSAARPLAARPPRAAFANLRAVNG